MTYAAILSRVQYMLFGDAPTPAPFLAQLVGPEGLIQDACVDIQRADDFWFMREEVDVGLPAGSALELETLVPRIKTFKGASLLDADGNVLRELDPISDAEARAWGSLSRAVGPVPQKFRVIGPNLVVYPALSADVTVRIDCYRYMPALPADFTGYSDALSDAAGFCIAARAAHLGAGVLDDDALEARYDTRYRESLAELTRVNMRHRDASTRNAVPRW